MLLVGDLGETLLHTVSLEAEEHVVVFVLNIAFLISLEVPLLDGGLILGHADVVTSNGLSL